MSCKGGIASYEDVKALKDDKGTLLVDVREPKELQETGVIPNSINIPCKYLYSFVSFLLCLYKMIPTMWL